MRIDRIKLYLLIFIASVFCSCSATYLLPELSYNLDSASVRTDGNSLIVTTGVVERVWRLNEKGLSTTTITNLDSGKVWSSAGGECDWEIVGVSDCGGATLQSLTATSSTDDHFTSEHIDVVAEIYYPQSSSTVKYHIWVYPDAPGIRTQLYVKGDTANREISQTGSNAVSFKRVRGKMLENYSANSIVEKHISSTIEDKSAIELQIFGIDLNKRYKVGVTLWSFKERDVVQDITITSVDGESRKVVAEGVEVPSYLDNERKAKELIVDLPTDILLDNSCRLYIDGANGFATISELYVYEESD